MRVEVLTTLKGEHLWKRGMVFDDAIAPIPLEILRELNAASLTVRCLDKKGGPGASREKIVPLPEPVFFDPDPDMEEEPAANPFAGSVTDNESETVETSSKEAMTMLEDLLYLCRGNKSAVARAIPIHPNMVGFWFKGKRRINKDHQQKIAVALERLRSADDPGRTD